MRKAIMIFLMSTLALLVSAEVLLSQQDNSPQRSRIPKPPVFKALDANDDDIISASEMADAASALKSLDKNGDGVLTPDEMMPEGMKKPESKGNSEEYYIDKEKSQMNNGRTPEQIKKRGKRPRRTLPPLIAAMDTDKDGKISSAEINNAPTSLKTMDKDGDGQLVYKEIRKRWRSSEQDGSMNKGRKG